MILYKVIKCPICKELTELRYDGFKYKGKCNNCNNEIEVNAMGDENYFEDLEERNI